MCESTVKKNESTRAGRDVVEGEKAKVHLLLITNSKNIYNRFNIHKHTDTCYVNSNKEIYRFPSKLNDEVPFVKCTLKAFPELEKTSDCLSLPSGVLSLNGRRCFLFLSGRED